MAVLRKKKNVVKRKKSVLPLRSQGSYSFINLVKPLIILVCVLCGYLVYSYWTDLLEKLDQKPISAYALTHKLQFTTEADIRETLMKMPNLKGYFAQDIAEIETELLKMPWIRGVVARKLWPDRLSLTLLEHRPVAIWNNNQLLSEQGVVFSLPAGRVNLDGLPILYGSDSQSKLVLDTWNEINIDLKVRQLVLKSVSVDDRGSWQITLADGIILKLGRGKWREKIDRFVTIFPQVDIPEGKRISYVDLRYEHGAAIGFSKK